MNTNMEQLLAYSHEYAALFDPSGAYEIITVIDKDSWIAQIKLTKNKKAYVTIMFDMHNMFITSVYCTEKMEATIGFVAITYAYLAGRLLEKGHCGSSIVWLDGSQTTESSCELMGIPLQGGDFIAKPEVLWNKSLEFMRAARLRLLP